MTALPLGPATDLLMKKWLANDAHPDVTRGFMKDFFGFDIPAGGFHIAAPYSIGVIRELLPAIRTGGPFTRRQRKLFETLRDATIDIDQADLISEVQVHREAGFLDRALYYLCTRYASHYQPQAGKYRALRPVHAMNLIGFPLLPDEPYGLQRFVFRDQVRPDGTRLDRLTIGFFEYARTEFPDPILGLWASFMRGEPLPADAPDYLHEAAGIIDYINLSGEEQEMIDLAEKYDAIQEGILLAAQQDAYAEGRTEGRTEGRAEERAALARRALALGYSLEDVALVSSLSMAEVTRLWAETGGAQGRNQR